MATRSAESRIWEQAKDGCKLTIACADWLCVIYGRVTWTDTHTIGFLPKHGSTTGLETLGLKVGVESLIFKGAIRAMTPEGEHGRTQRGKDSPR